MRARALTGFLALVAVLVMPLGAWAQEYNALCDRNNSNFYGFYGKESAELTCVASWAGRLAVKNQDLKAENQVLQSENQRLREEVARLKEQNASLNEGVVTLNSYAVKLENENNILMNQVVMFNSLYSIATDIKNGLYKEIEGLEWTLFIVVFAALAVIAVLIFLWRAHIVDYQKIVKLLNALLGREREEKLTFEKDRNEFSRIMTDQAVELAKLRNRGNTAEFKGAEYEVHNDGVLVRQKDNPDSKSELFLNCRGHAGSEVKPKNMVPHLKEAHSVSGTESPPPLPPLRP